MYSSPPLHQLSSESRHCSVSLGCLVSRIIHHLEHSWPPWVTKVDLPAGVLPFSKIDGLSDLQALRLPPSEVEAAGWRPCLHANLLEGSGTSLH